jgi:hypothetical protein
MHHFKEHINKILCTPLERYFHPCLISILAAVGIKTIMFLSTNDH